MSEKIRKCHTCAWWEDIEDIDKDLEGWRIEDGHNRRGKCHFEPAAIRNLAFEWCRHWSEITGWDRFEKQPTQLEQAAAKIFELVAKGDKALMADITRWLEEYRRQC